MEVSQEHGKALEVYSKILVSSSATVDKNKQAYDPSWFREAIQEGLDNSLVVAKIFPLRQVERAVKCACELFIALHEALWKEVVKNPRIELEPRPEALQAWSRLLDHPERKRESGLGWVHVKFEAVEQKETEYSEEIKQCQTRCMLDSLKAMFQVKFEFPEPEKPLKNQDALPIQDAGKDGDGDDNSSDSSQDLAEPIDKPSICQRFKLAYTRMILKELGGMKLLDEALGDAIAEWRKLPDPLEMEEDTLRELLKQAKFPKYALYQLSKTILGELLIKGAKDSLSSDPPHCVRSARCWYPGFAVREVYPGKLDFVRFRM